MNLNDRLHTWWMTYVVTTGEEEGNRQRSYTSIRFLCSRRYKDELLLPLTRWLAGIMLDACTSPVCLNVADVLLSYSNFIYLFIFLCVCVCVCVTCFSFPEDVLVWVGTGDTSRLTQYVAIQPNVIFRDCSCFRRCIACYSVFPVTVAYIWVQRI
jgi:hypothetical protein